MEIDLLAEQQSSRSSIKGAVILHFGPIPVFVQSLYFFGRLVEGKSETFAGPGIETEVKCAQQCEAIAVATYKNHMASIM